MAILVNESVLLRIFIIPFPKGKFLFLLSNLFSPQCSAGIGISFYRFASALNLAVAAQWCRTPLFLDIGRQRQADIQVCGQPGLQSDFPDS